MAAISSPDLRPSTVFQCQLVSSDGNGATGQILTDKLQSQNTFPRLQHLFYIGEELILPMTDIVVSLKERLQLKRWYLFLFWPAP